MNKSLAALLSKPAFLSLAAQQVLPPQLMALLEARLTPGKGWYV